MTCAQETIGRALDRRQLYRLFSRLFLYPRDEVVASWDWEKAAQAARRLDVPSAFEEQFKALRGAPREPDGLRSKHIGIFGYTVGKANPPYETEWGGTHIFEQTQELADIAGFYRAWGLEVSDQAKERPDHVSVETEFMSYMALKEAYALEKGNSEGASISREVQVKFLGEHLGRWIPAFASALEDGAKEGFYAFLARAIREWVAGDAGELGAKPEPLKPILRRGEAQGDGDCHSCGSIGSGELVDGRIKEDSP